MSSEEMTLYQKLEQFVEHLATENNAQHNHILEQLDKFGDKIDRSVQDVNWIKQLSKILLIPIFGYFITLAYFIYTNNWADEKECTDIKHWIRDGEVKHYKNENRLSHIEEYIKLEKEGK